MNLKRILSSALIIVMMFTALIAVIPPVEAGAVYITGDNVLTNKTEDELKALIEAATDSDYETAQDMLDAEYALGYLAMVKSGNYSIYVNRYTGVFYYKNDITGQIMTSTPHDIGYKNAQNSNMIAADNRNLLLSQLVISFSEITTGKKYNYNSTEWAAMYGQITTEYIKGGIRVNYTLGDTAMRFLLPGRILAVEFEELFMIPLLEKFESKMTEAFGENPAFSFLDNTDYEAYAYGRLDKKAIDKYFKDLDSEYKFTRTNYSEDSQELIAAKAELKQMKQDFDQLMAKYSLQNLAEKESSKTAYDLMVQNYYTPVGDADRNAAIYDEDSEYYRAPMYTYKKGDLENQKKVSASILQKYSGSYSFSEMYEDEEICAYIDNTEKKPVIRCALEYTINSDGTLSVRLPANSITFDETVYVLESIVPLQFFGAGDLAEDGFVFFPDGSGTVVDFEDFYDATGTTTNKTLYLQGTVFGTDYCYSNITGARREQITMPVYGVVNTEEASDYVSGTFGVSSVKNGYFAILEEGESLATMGFRFGGSEYKYGNAFCSYNPYPSDTYDLSETISVGGSASYTIVADSKYSGSYVTKYVMLTDAKIGNQLGVAYYPATYVGMATYYRDYLYANGTLSALTEVNPDLPLYIEALGSMDIITKILTFPITKSIPLTTFEDIQTMYNELSNTSAVFLAKAAEAQAQADAAEEESSRIYYAELAAKYTALAQSSKNITNVNFRLTGFGNGGLYATYPTKVRWDRACGGKRAFNTLISEAERISAEAGKTFGVYPEYDFMYINYTEMFDGISTRGNVSRMVDNRYASKQEYNAVIQDYESFFTLVINPAALENLYAKFIKQYSKYEVGKVSVSTMGSDLNSNFDEDESINRYDAQGYVTSVLNSMKNEAGLEIMTDKGNLYSLKYASHILNLSTDSSHFRYSSYTVPFVGMVLHGSVNYAGNPLNYAGTPEYDILRAIESGASLYYILCYQNSTYIKDDIELNDYYGVDYNTWFDEIVGQYTTLNDAIAELQTYKIVDHRTIIGERVIGADEALRNDKLLKAEIIEILDKALYDKVNEGFEALNAMQGQNGYGAKLNLVVDTAKLHEQFTQILNADITTDTAFVQEIANVIAKYTSSYKNEGGYEIKLDAIDYVSEYDFLTDSYAADEDYDYTAFTADDNLVLVTYSNGEREVSFILNYNVYSVNVKLDGVQINEPIEKYGFHKIG